MNTSIKNQSGSVNIQPEKLYTQKDVDDLHKNWNEDEDKKRKAAKKFQAKEKDIKDDKKQTRINDRKVARLVKSSNTILASVTSSALPFDFFPNTINVEEKRITIIDRHLLSSEVHSIDIKNISNILINNSIIFSQLVIISDTYEENEIKVRNLRTHDAVYIRKIIEGLRIFENENIDTHNYTKKELISKLEELSTTKIVK